VDASAEPAASDLSLGQATSGLMDWVPSSEESTAADPRTGPNPTEINRRGAGTDDRGSA
jgi:hypothetical protein